MSTNTFVAAIVEHCIWVGVVSIVAFVIVPLFLLMQTSLCSYLTQKHPNYLPAQSPSSIPSTLHSSLTVHSCFRWLQDIARRVETNNASLSFWLYLVCAHQTHDSFAVWSRDWVWISVCFYHHVSRYCVAYVPYFPTLHLSEQPTVNMKPKRMISRTLAVFLWYSNIIFEEDFSEAVDEPKDFLVRVFLLYLCD